MIKLMEECYVCLDTMNDPLILDCGHIFHKECIKKITNFICPLCRYPIDLNKIFNLNYHICNGDPKTHYEYGYSPFVKNGSCRFCFGYPLNKFN